MDKNKLPLKGVRVLDIATMMAAPWAATYLGDYGAEVIKIEHPERGDNCRKFGKEKDGKGIFWKSIGRNKKCVTLNISKPEGKELFLKLIKDCDVLIENFRPGTMEKWQLGWEELSAVNPRLIWLRCSGFGQEGPYSKRGGFGTIAEGMSGFAYLNGYPDSPPTLPPIALADGVCSAFSALAVMIALYERDVQGSGLGQVIDISLYEPLMRLMETPLLEYEVLGTVPNRMGNRIASAAPRNLYQTREGKWVSLSGSSQTIAEKVFQAIGRPELIEDPRFKDNGSRVNNVEELDQIIGSWIKEHSLEQVLEEFTAAGAVVGQIYHMADIYNDEQVKYRQSFVPVTDKDFGEIRVPNVFAKFSRTPGQIFFTGRDLGEDNEEVFCDGLGLSKDELEQLKEKGVV